MASAVIAEHGAVTELTVDGGEAAQPNGRSDVASDAVLSCGVDCWPRCADEEHEEQAKSNAETTKNAGAVMRFIRFASCGEVTAVAKS